MAGNSFVTQMTISKRLSLKMTSVGQLRMENRGVKVEVELQGLVF